MAVNVLAKSSFMVVFVGSLIATPVAQQPKQFEVVSIKQTAPGPSAFDAPGTSTVQATRFRGTNMTVAGLIQQAFRESAFPRLPELVDAPGWTTTAKYEIDARFAPMSSQTEVFAQLPVLRAMLEDRFKLKAHRETRNVPAFALVRARSDGQLGPHIRPTAADCDAYVKQRARATPSDDAKILKEWVAGNPPPCNMMSTNGNRRTAHGFTMSALVANISGAAGRYVFDDTGLTGWFDYELEYARDPLAQGDVPTIFTALPEQLGLKLESREAPVPVVVVDHVERPTPD